MTVSAMWPPGTERASNDCPRFAVRDLPVDFTLDQLLAKDVAWMRLSFHITRVMMFVLQEMNEEIDELLTRRSTSHPISVGNRTRGRSSRL